MRPPVQKLGAMAAVLSPQVNGLIALWQARSALLSGAPGRSKADAERGLHVLAEKKTSPMSPEVDRSLALQAALTAILATAQQREGIDSGLAEKNFQQADAKFTVLVSSRTASVAPFLSDYFLMLTEFGATLKDVEATQKLTTLIRNLIRGFGSGTQRITSLAWLRATMISPSARLALDLGVSLKADGDRAGAIEAFVQSSAMAMASNDETYALEAVENAFVLDPGNMDARRVRGVLYWRAGYIRGAREDFEAIVENDSMDLEARAALAQAWFRQGRSQLASKELTIILYHNKNHIDALWLRGEIELRRGDYDAARRVDATRRWQTARASLTRALELAPDHINARRSRAVANYRLRDLEDAFADLDTVLAAEPDDAESYGWRAAILLEQKKATEALVAVNLALTLFGSGSLGQNSAWLLGLKGRALLEIQWLDQAIEVLLQTVSMEPKNWELACYLLQAYRCKRAWKPLSECAQSLQKNKYGQWFLCQLRREEIAALRNLGDYVAAFAAINRPPLLLLNDPEMKWLRARLLADIGDFESVIEILTVQESDPALTADQLSLRAWAFQNLEAKDPQHRVILAQAGVNSYQAALNNKSQSPTDRMWLRKGLANAWNRAGDRSQAELDYKEVITECEERTRMAAPNPTILNLLGWCHHHLAEYDTALRYYEAAASHGEQPIAAEFDCNLTHCAAAAGTARPDGRKLVERYQATVLRARKENLLRRIGQLRVALHDLREFLFVVPEIPRAGEIGQLLCIELLETVAKVPAEFDEVCRHIHTFLETAISAPLPIFDTEREALRLKIEASQLLREGEDDDALELLRAAAIRYSDPSQRVWAAKTWRDIAFLSLRREDAPTWYYAASRSLESGLYSADQKSAWTLLSLVTRHALEDSRAAADYPLLLHKIFSEVGPDIAYLSAAKITEAMPSAERKLFLSTTLEIFPYDGEDRWIFIGEGKNRRQIPHNDRVLEPFLPYIAKQVKRFSDVKDAVMSLVD